MQLISSTAPRKRAASGSPAGVILSPQVWCVLGHQQFGDVEPGAADRRIYIGLLTQFG
jgi:hypothetical protein